MSFSTVEKREKKKRTQVVVQLVTIILYYFTINIYYYTVLPLFLSLWGLTSLRGLGTVFDELSPLLRRSGVVNPLSYGLLCAVLPSHARSPGKGKQKNRWETKPSTSKLRLTADRPQSYFPYVLLHITPGVEAKYTVPGIKNSTTCFTAVFYNRWSSRAWTKI